jgi:general secretion pathway protein I
MNGSNFNHRCIKSRTPLGFTLMEVLVALAVLAIALTSIYRLQGQTFLMSASARFYSQAPQLARWKLAEVETQKFEDVTGGSGDFGEDYPGYSWSLSVEDLPSDLITSKQYHLARIEITVSKNDENSYQLRTYRFYAE